MCYVNALHRSEEKLLECKEVAVSGAQALAQSMKETYAAVGSFFSRTIYKVRTTTHDGIVYAKPILSWTVKKTIDIVIPTMAALAASIAFLANTSLFIIGGVTAILVPQQINSSIERIVAIWHTQQCIGKTVIFTTCAIAWPITLGFSSFFVGAAVSLWLQRIAAKNVNKQPVSP